MDITFDTYGNEKQKYCAELWADNIKTDIVYGGAKGGGKSYLGVSLIFGNAMMYPNTHYFIARASLTSLRKYTIPSIHEVFSHWGITDNYYKYNGMDNYFNLYNGSKVYLIDAKYLPSDPLFSRFGSMQMTQGWIEEAGEFNLECRNNLAASIGRWNNEQYNLTGKLLQTCNPSKNYLYKNYYLPFRDGTLSPHQAFIQALPQDNKRLDSGYIDNLHLQLNDHEKRRLLFGEWEYDDDKSALINYEAILNLFSNNFVPNGNKYISVDAARFGGDKIVIVLWSGFRGKVYTYKQQGLDITSGLIERLRLENGVPVSNVIVDEDGLGGGLVDFMKYRGFINNSRPMPSPDRPYNDNGQLVYENYDNLKSQCYYRLSEIINRNEMYIEIADKEKQDLIEELEQVKMKDLNSDMKKGVVQKDIVKQNIGRSPDISDAIMMRMFFELVPKRIFLDSKY